MKQITHMAASKYALYVADSDGNIFTLDTWNGNGKWVALPQLPDTWTTDAIPVNSLAKNDILDVLRSIKEELRGIKNSV